MEHSRTYNSIRNGAVALILYFLNLILQFISRKIFIDHLGADVLGLNTTMTSIMQFLNITEMGIGTAIACTLYAPLRNQNQQHINEIISIHGWIYKRIACIVLGIGLLLACFFPFFFGKENLPLWYAYSTFGVLLFSAILNYTVTYKQVLLSANQQEYKVQLSYKLCMLLKLSMQIIAVKHASNGYIWWLALECIFAIISSIAVNYHVHITFPNLQIVNDDIKHLNAKHPSIKTKVSQLFFHKIASFALNQVSPIILYAFTSLVMVTKYGNYMLIVMGLQSLMMAIFNGLNASVGNLVSEGNNDRILTVFKELFSSRFVISYSLSLCLFLLSNSFIKLWVGKEFVLDNIAVLLISIIFFINTLRTVVDSYIQAYGLFKDIWAPIAEAMINIGLSILFGYLWGLNGILIGVLISLILIVCIWKPYLLFKQGIKVQVKHYVIICVKLLVAGFMCLYPIIIFAHHLRLSEINNYSEFLCKSGILLSVTFMIISAIVYTIEPGMRQFIARIYSIIIKQKK